MGTVGLRVKEQPSLIDIIDSREGTYGVSQDYRDFSPMMGTLADMAGDQPVYDESVVTDMPSRPVFDLPSYSTNMPDVSQTLPADTQLRMLDDAMPRTWGPVPSDGIVPIGGGLGEPSIDVQTQIDTFADIPSVDYSQVMTDAGMADVVMSAQAQQASAEADEGFFGGFGDIARIDIPGIDTNIGDILLNLDPDKKDGYVDKQDIIERLVGLGLLTSDQADQAKQYAWQTDTDTNWVQRLFQIAGTALTAPILQMIDEGSIPAGLRAAFNNQLGIFGMPDSVVPGTIELIEEMTKGNIKPSELDALVNLDPGTVNSADIAEILSQVDTFADLADVDVQTQTDTFEDIDKIAEDTAARQAQLDADKSAAALQHQENVAAAAEEHEKNVAIARDKQRVNKRERMRKAQLRKTKLEKKKELRLKKAKQKSITDAIARGQAAQKDLEDRVRKDLEAARDRGGVSTTEVQAAIAAMQGLEFGGMLGIPGGEAADRASVGIDAGGKYSGGGPF
jgi:hypothetical protein